MTATYLLPLRRSIALAAASELAVYLRRLASRMDVLVVDGSASDVVAAHQLAFGDGVTVVTPDERDRCANGKAWGVLTGLRHAGHDSVVIADDDVRWNETSLARALDLLGIADLVIPQNYFEPLPWHAAWDTGRTLLNRFCSHDWPGTLVVRRSALSGFPAYDGNVLFENCELVRTLRARGGRVLTAHDLYVARRPPTTAQFLDQRPRQAYDDLAQPARLVLMLSLLPAVTVGRGRLLAALGVTAATLAEAGRRRAGGTAVFPWYTSLCAPLWLTERAVLAWWALWLRATRKGVPYAGGRMLVAATSPRALRARHRCQAARGAAATSADG